MTTQPSFCKKNTIFQPCGREPGEIGKQKISGSFGRFYEQLPASGITTVVGDIFQEIFRWDHDPREDLAGGLVFVTFDPRQLTFDPDTKGEHFDEFTLGYERELDGRFKLGIRGIYRTTREIIQNSADPTTGQAQAITGNPGRRLLSNMPDPKREYTALELTFEKFSGKGLRFLTFLRHFSQLWQLHGSVQLRHWCRFAQYGTTV